MDLSIFEGFDQKDQLLMERGVIKTEKGTCKTSLKGIYASGDAAFGAALFITAIRHGQEAARSIDSDLLGTKPYQEFSAEFTEIPAFRDKTYLKTKWALPSMQPSKLRIHNENLVSHFLLFHKVLKKQLHQSFEQILIIIHKNLHSRE